jgi:hypothetical protein
MLKKIGDQLNFNWTGIRLPLNGPSQVDGEIGPLGFVGYWGGNPVFKRQIYPKKQKTEFLLFFRKRNVIKTSM